MRGRKRGLRQYRCWLCGKHLAITVAPHQRHPDFVCSCPYPGGYTTPPSNLSPEEIEQARASLGEESIQA